MDNLIYFLDVDYIPIKHTFLVNTKPNVIKLNSCIEISFNQSINEHSDHETLFFR